MAMRALAKRWLLLNDEIREHEKTLGTLIEVKAPSLLKVHGIATMAIVKMLILIGDEPSRIKSEAAFLCPPVTANSWVCSRREILNRPQ